MKYYKHMSDMIDDVKIRRVVKKFGAEGYAVYNIILERITKRLDDENPKPDLEEASTDIADYLGMDTVKVEEITWFCVQQELFEQDEISGRILCNKIYKFLAKSATRSKRIQNLITSYTNGDNTPVVSDRLRPSQTVSDMHETSMQEEEKEEEEEEEQKKNRKRNYRAHPALNVPMSQGRYDGLVRTWGASTVDSYIQKVIDWTESDPKRETRDYAARAATFISRDVEAGKLRPLNNSGLSAAEKRRRAREEG